MAGEILCKSETRWVKGRQATANARRRDICRSKIIFVDEYALCKYSIEMRNLFSEMIMNKMGSNKEGLLILRRQPSQLEPLQNIMLGTLAAGDRQLDHLQLASHFQRIWGKLLTLLAATGASMKYEV